MDCPRTSTSTSLVSRVPAEFSDGENAILRREPTRSPTRIRLTVLLRQLRCDVSHRHFFLTEGGEMAEKVAKLGISRDKDYMLYVKDGAVWRVRRKQPGLPKGKPEKVADGGFQMDNNYIYFVDKDGDVSRAKRAVGGQKRKKTPAKAKKKKAAPKKAKKKATRKATKKAPAKKKKAAGKKK